MNPVERLDSGGIIYTPGCSPLVLIAPFCPIWQRINEPTWNKAGRAIKPDGQLCFQWRSHAKTHWNHKRTKRAYRRWLKRFGIDGWRSLRLPTHKLFPCWVVAPYGGGDVQDYLNQGMGTPTILRWAGKLQFFNLYHEIEGAIAQQHQRNKAYKLALLMRGKRYCRRAYGATSRRHAIAGIANRSIDRAVAQRISTGRGINPSTSKSHIQVPEAS